MRAIPERLVAATPLLPAGLRIEDVLDAAGDGTALLQRSNHSIDIIWASRRFRAVAGIDGVPGNATDRLTLVGEDSSPLPIEAIFTAASGSAQATFATPSGVRHSRVCWRTVDPVAATSLLTLIDLDAVPQWDQLQRAADGAQIGFFRYDLGADTVELSAECYRMRGSQTPAPGHTERGAFLRTVHAEDQRAVGEGLDRLAAGALTEWDAELRVPTASGDWLWVQLRAHVRERDPAGRARRLVGMLWDIDRRKRAERGLARSEARYRTVVAMSPGFVHESAVAADGRFMMQWASDGFTRILGWTVDEVNERGGVASLIHPDQRDFAAQRRRDALAGEPVQIELCLLAKSGAWVWFAASGFPLQDPETGRVVSMMGSLHDITSLKLAEAELRASEERFRVAMDAVSGIMYQRDIATGVVTCSAAVIDVLGLGADAQSATFDWWVDRVHPADAPRYVAERTGADDGSRILSSRYRLRHADGHYIDVLDRAVHLRDARGVVERVIGCAMDVSREGRATRLLGEAEALAHVGSWEADLRTGEIIWSDETYRIFGVERNVFRPSIEAPLAFCTAGSEPLLRAALRRAIDLGSGFDIEFEIQTDGGSRRWLRATCRAEMGAGEPLRLFGAIQDIDARKRSEIRVQGQSDWLRLAMDAAQVVAWRWQPGDDRLLIEYRSPAFDPQIPFADTLEADLLDVHPDDRDRIRTGMRRTIATGKPGEFSVRVTDLRGRQRWVTTRTIRATTDGTVFLIGATSDTTARHAAEDALRSSEAVLRSVSENSPDYIVVTDANLNATFVNRRLQGERPLDAVGHLFEAAPGGERLEVQERLRTVLATGRPLRFESVGRRADGSEALFENHVGPVHEGSEVTGVIVYATDITERRALEREILEISNREQRRIGSDLHDGLGQELTGIALMLRGITSALARGAAPRTGDLDEVVALVNGAIDTTRTLARGLSPVALEGGGLVDALRTLVARTREMYGLDIRFRSRVTAPVTLDASATGHLYRIAQESLTNAARHAHASVVTVRISAGASRLTLSVVDDGCGLGSTAGLGMGLKIMRYRSHMIAGDLRVESAGPGRGTRISCSVLQSTAAAAANEHRA